MTTAAHSAAVDRWVQRHGARSHGFNRAFAAHMSEAIRDKRVPDAWDMSEADRFFVVFEAVDTHRDVLKWIDAQPTLRGGRA